MTQSFPIFPLPNGFYCLVQKEKVAQTEGVLLEQEYAWAVKSVGYEVPDKIAMSIGKGDITHAIIQNGSEIKYKDDLSFIHIDYVLGWMKK